MSSESTEGSNRQWIARLALFGLGAVVVTLTSASFMLRDNERAVVLRFGKPVREVNEAGWYGKWPWPVEQVERLDGRLQYGEIRLSETLTRDKRNIIVPMYYAWRVEDPLKFLRSVGTLESGNEKLDSIISSARNSVLGRTDYADLVSVEKSDETMDALEGQILAQAADDAHEYLGIGLSSVGVLQLNLPENNTESVFRRMRAERKREASKYRAEGKSEAERLRAETDKETSILIAEAKRYAEEKHGEAEAEAARIYAAAHSQDLEFYLFMRQLQSLRSVVDQNTTLLLDTSTPPFSLIKPSGEMEAQMIRTQQVPSTQKNFPTAAAIGLDPEDTPDAP
ncbi:MAG: membrane protease subunit HflC [Puniceicoccaceae bacterium 5H]|nr:MAG: membrane protease subunit HflC [Puniceicoccaceae bacterium 5H]